MKMTLRDWGIAMGLIVSFLALVVGALRLHIDLKKESATVSELWWFKVFRDYGWALKPSLFALVGMAGFFVALGYATFDPGPASRAFVYWAVWCAIMIGVGFTSLGVEAVSRRMDLHVERVLKFNDGVMGLISEHVSVTGRHADQSLRIHEITMESLNLHAETQRLRWEAAEMKEEIARVERGNSQLRSHIKEQQDKK